jgi:signal peptidase II
MLFVKFQNPSRLPGLLGLSALIFLADRLSKIWIRTHIRVGEAIAIVPRILHVTHSENDGAAFSIMRDSATPELVRWVLTSFSLLAVIVVLFAMIRLGRRITPMTVALALILGGAAGNLYDRICQGMVTDFIQVHVSTYYYWPDFNVADSSIVTGGCLFALEALRRK